MWSVCIDAKHCQKILKDDFLKEHIVDGHNVKRVINNEKNKDKKNILLKPTVAEETIEALKEKGFELQKVTLKTTYENTSMISFGVFCLTTCLYLQVMKLSDTSRISICVRNNCHINIL